MRSLLFEYEGKPIGGGVIHRVTVPGRKGRFSAWFDKAGKLVAAEQILTGRCLPVKKDASIWNYLKSSLEPFGELEEAGGTKNE